MNLIDQIERIYDTDTYLDAMATELSNDQQKIQTEIRFGHWIRINEEKLMDIYFKKIAEGDTEACSIAWITWSRLSFFIYEYNARMKDAIDQEMREMLGN